MDTINVIDAKLEEIANKIKRETRKIRLTRRQCEQMSKNLSKTKNCK